MKKFIKYLIIVGCILFLLLSNFTYLNVYLPQCYPYRFCSDKCTFEVYELGKGHDPIGRVELYFKQYKESENKPNLVLYRRFPRKWWQVWNWYDFLSHRRWSYPYAERDEDT